jgi:hypothetical protein
VAINVNVIIGLVAICLYLTVFGSGVWVLRKSCALSRKRWSAVWFSSISGLCFAVLYPEYIAAERYNGIGAKTDMIWALVHLLNATSIILLHLGVLRDASD